MPSLRSFHAYYHRPELIKLKACVQIEEGSRSQKTAVAGEAIQPWMLKPNQ